MDGIGMRGQVFAILSTSDPRRIKLSVATRIGMNTNGSTNYKSRAQIQRDPIQMPFVLTMLGVARAAPGRVTACRQHGQFGATAFSLWPHRPHLMIERGFGFGGVAPHG
jgi:hypothetical protein